MRSKNQILTIILLVIGFSGYTQQLERQVIAAAGSSSAGSFTIGEVIISSSNLEVISGFQQPTFLDAPSLGVRDISKELTVYPVPTRDELTIKGFDFSVETTRILLYNIEGKEVQVALESASQEIKLNLTNIPSGSYFLTLNDPDRQTIAKYKILKLK